MKKHDDTEAIESNDFDETTVKETAAAEGAPDATPQADDTADVPVSEEADTAVVEGEETEEIAVEPDEEAAFAAEPTEEVDPQEPEPSGPTLLILHASVGSGHRSAAIAVAQAFALLRDRQLPAFPDGSKLPVNTRIEVLDVLRYGRIVFDGDKYASSFTGWTRPLYDLNWRYTLTGRVLWAGGTAFNRIMYPAFTEYIAKVKPLAVVATHIMGANVATGARMITGQDFPIVCVPTDYETEGLWPHKTPDAFCVATEAMAETLRPRKVPEENIFLTGIPVRQDFVRHYQRDEVREELHLPKDKKLIVALAGASLSQPYVRFREILDEALPSLNKHPNMQLIIIAGKDVEYANRVRQLCEDYGMTNVTVLEYVNYVAKLMSASDLVICKAGGLTVTECLCTQTPMILLGRAYGQEKANVNMLTSNGAAMHATTARELMDALNQLSQHPQRLSSLLVNARLLSRPHAAVAVARVALKQTCIPEDQARGERKKHFLHFYLGKRPAHTR